MIELADQFHRALEGVEVAIPVITDVHPAPTDRTVAIEDVELPGREIGIRRPSVGHRADLQVLMNASGRQTRTRGYARILASSSHLSGRCKKSLDVAGCGLDQRRDMIQLLKDDYSI